MRLLMIGKLGGQLVTASKMALAAGAKVLHAEDINIVVEEFLNFKGINTSKLYKEKLKFFLPTFNDLYKKEYAEFIEFGGFPEVVLADDKVDKIEYFKDIHWE